MMRGWPGALALLFMLGVSGCGWIGQDRIAQPPKVGRVEDNVYTSPRRSFRFRIPWLASEATLHGESPTPSTTIVTLRDRLCREFVISERPGFLGTQSLESWVDTHIIQDLKRLGLEVQSKSLTTPNGAAMALRYRAPAAAPCSQTTEKDGHRVETKLDADVGWHVYYRDGFFYRLIYILGVGPGAPSLWYVNRGPVDEVLGKFAEGFEILSSNARGQ